MKRLLVVTVLAVGLLAVAGATSVERLGMTIADGQPPPPPKKLTTPGPWLVQSA
jgi:hypothetical protein